MSDTSDEQDLHDLLKKLNDKNNPESPYYQDQQSIGQSMLYKTLLQQSMNQPTANSAMGPLVKMLSTYAAMRGMQPQTGLTVNTGNPGASLGMMPTPGM